MNNKNDYSDIVLKGKYERIYKNEKVLEDFNIPKTILGNAYSLSEGSNRYIAQQLMYKRDAEIESGIYARSKNNEYIIAYILAVDKLGTVSEEAKEKLASAYDKDLNISKFLPKLSDWYKPKGSGIESPTKFGSQLEKDIFEGIDEYLMLTGDKQND